MNDPYKILGISPRATEAEIKSAYRTLAKKYHPDMDPGNQSTLERFREINNAYDHLVRELRRTKAAENEIFGRGTARWRSANRTASENPDNFKPETYGSTQTGQRQSGKTNSQKTNAGQTETNDQASAKRSAEEIFSDLFSGFRSPKSKPAEEASTEPKDDQISYKIKLSLAEACMGTSKRIRLANRQKLDVKIPAGIEDGQHIRVKNPGAGENGTIIQIAVEDHPYFTRHGANVHMELPVTVDEAVLGSRITVPTLNGSVILKIPEGSNTDSIFRLRGKGGLVRGVKDKTGKPARGDQYVSLKVVLPDNSDKGFFKLIKKWAMKNQYSVRQHLENGEKAA